MATWVVHFRIADYFLNKIEVAPKEFVVGSIAPDCGYGKKDSIGNFDPPPTVTHWSPSGMKRDCRYKDFYNEYLKKKNKDNNDYSFYLGYYVHLLTDIMWSCEIFAPAKIMYKAQFAENPDFIHTIKRDWNDLDFRYLSIHPDLRPYKILQDIKKVKDYLPYYEPGQLTVQSRFIVDYYKKGKESHDFNRSFKYLNPEIVDNFIECACELINRDLKKKKLV
ncbi:MAG: zinc dependent phospholipase C family protein [bacterium]|nr:zinc dependent phospholipase C family protein [bacterium]